MTRRLFLARARRAGEFPDPFDVAAIDALAVVMARHDLTAAQIEHDGRRVRLTRAADKGSGNSGPLAGARPGTADARETHRAAFADLAGEPAGAITSPMVGTTYLRSGPDGAPFVEVGATVKPGDKLLLIESLQTFNDVVSPCAGRVASILVTDGQPVEFGQVLMIIEEAR